MQRHLDTKALTRDEYEALAALCESLKAGDCEAWEDLVLEKLGLETVEEIAHFCRSVLVHVFRHGCAPSGQSWYHPDRDVVADLIDTGYIDENDGELSLTDEVLATAGVLEPDPVSLHTGQAAYGVIIGPVRGGSQRTIRLQQVADY